MIATERYSIPRTFLLGFGFLGVSVIWAIYNSYVPIFLQEDFGLNANLTGLIMAIDNIFAIILLPFLGALSDRTRTRMGRRKPYILIGSILGAVFFAFIPTTMATRALALGMVTIILMNLSMALFRSPVIALMPDTTPSKYRSQANGIINVMGGVASALVLLGGKLLYRHSRSLLFVVGGLVMLAACAIVLVFVKEPPVSEEPAAAAVPVGDSFKELLTSLKEVFAKEKSLLLVLMSIFFWFIGYNAIETFFTSYAKYYLGIEESTGTQILFFFSAAFLVTALVMGFIKKRLVRKNTIRLGLVILLCILLASLLLRSFWLLAAAFLVGGVGWAFVNVNSLPMVVDMTTKEKIGAYTGLYYLFSQGAMVISPPIAGFIIDRAGYASLMVYSCVFFAAAMVTMSFVKRGEAAPSG